MTGKIKKILLNKDGENFVADIENIENRITQNTSDLQTAKQDLSTSISTNLATAKSYADNKANDALANAKNYTDTEKAKYLPRDGGTFAFSSQNNIEYMADRDDGYLIIRGSKMHSTGSALYLCGKDCETPYNEDLHHGSWVIQTPNSEASKYFQLKGTRDGSLTFRGQEISRYSFVTQYNQCSYKFGDNMCVQMGRVYVPSDKDYATVNLLYPFKDTAYLVFAQALDPDNNLIPAIVSHNYTTKTTTAFNLVSSFERQGTWIKSNPKWGIDWLAIGFSA